MKNIKPALLYGVAALFAVLIIFIFVQNILFQKELKELQSRYENTSSLFMEEQNLLSRNMIKAAGAIDSLKNILGTSPVQWDWGTPAEEEGSTEQELEDLEELDIFYSAVDLLVQTENRYQKTQDFIDRLTQLELENILQSRGLNYRLVSQVTAGVYKGDKQLFFLSVDEDSRLYMETEDGQVILEPGKDQIGEAADAAVEALSQRQDQYVSLTGTLRNILSNTTVAELVLEKDLKPRYYTGDNGLELAIRLIDYSEVERITLDRNNGSIYLQDEEFFNAQDFTQGLIEYLQSLDHRTEVQIADDNAIELVQKAIADDIFLEYLNTRNYQISTTPLPHIDEAGTESDYLHWDITRDGESVGSIALLETFGELYLLDADDIPIRSFRGFTQNHQIQGDSNYEYSEDFEVLTDLYSSSSSTTYLMIGTHEKNADTMILLHANLDTGQTHMISVPRDLWYNNRKVNSVYRYYGPEALVRELSELTGLRIDHYISVDMYAFIEVVDIMGGIDMVLDEPLIDPTYKVKVNGQWTTLHYPAGPVHLDGLGALRVARSRHSTNDFDRARRQQRVISAMKDKASQMGLSDMDMLFQFISAARQYTDSNMSPSAMLRAFLKYKDTEIITGNVIDNTNILYTSYSNLYELTEEERQAANEDPEFNKGAWIVLPRNNDWNLIKWFIREMIDGNNP